ncbi:guanine methyltransferase Trm5 [Phyllosticta citrichinensis]|uniref:tRNA (guanine(37)-N1)-methyltransferase n=1 Tax=Phyllosticta citrichinensis TaxID=1130410 RepID=A0ABR1XRM1_9PEZI
MSEPNVADLFRPPVDRAMRTLDRGFFKKTFPISAAAVKQKKDISAFRQVLSQSNDALNLPRLSLLQEAPNVPDTKCILLRPEIKHDYPSTWSPTLTELANQSRVELIPYDLILDYDYWSYDQIMSAIVPEENQEMYFPKRFTEVGHVVHLNLGPEHEPYKKIFSQVLIDKSSRNIKTVINKLSNVGDENAFRTFKYEVLAGPDDLMVEHHEEKCLFRFDFGKVYWNSRLQEEHRRIVQKFVPGEVVVDVMAGVGPFAIPAGKKRVFVLANDLNPESYAYMEGNITANRVDKFVQPYNEDGHAFIRNAAANLFNQSVQAGIHDSIPKSAKPPQRQSGSPKPKKFSIMNRPQVPSHFVMNLPASAIDFLPSFIGLYTRSPVREALGGTDPRTLFAPHTADKLPMIHVHCFCPKFPTAAESEEEILQRISEKLEFKIDRNMMKELDGEVHDVRDIAPGKEMFCVSFRLPAEVAFRQDEDVDQVDDALE